MPLYATLFYIIKQKFVNKVKISLFFTIYHSSKCPYLIGIKTASIEFFKKRKFEASSYPKLV